MYSGCIAINTNYKIINKLKSLCKFLNDLSLHKQSFGFWELMVVVVSMTEL